MHSERRCRILGAIVVLAWGCGGADRPIESADRPPREPPGAPIEASGAEKRVASCAELERHLQDAAVRQMERVVDEPNGWDNPRPPILAATVAYAMAGEATGRGADTANAVVAPHNPIAGIDEPDFVKHDGARMFILDGNTLHTLRSWPPQDLAHQGALTIEGHPQGIVLHAEKNLVVVFSTVEQVTRSSTGDGDGTSPAPLAPEIRPRCPSAVPEDQAGTPCPNPPAEKISFVDVADLSRPRLVREIHLPGRYLRAYKHGSTLRMVLGDEFRWPPNLSFEVDWSGDANDPKTTRRLAELREQLKAANAKVIRTHALTAWLPSGAVRLADGSLRDLSYRCTDFAITDLAPTRLGLATVVTISLDDPDRATRTSFTRSVDDVYASTQSLYLGSEQKWSHRSNETYLYRYDIGREETTRYLASGRVDGGILLAASGNPQAIDEHEGFLRVATTIYERTSDPAVSFGWLTSERISVLGTEAGALKVIGQTLAKGSSVSDVRFLGTRAFVGMDKPNSGYYAVDLSDPKAPRVMGKFPATVVADRVYALGDKHLLTVGTYWGGREPGRVGPRDTQLAVWDVSDLAEPKQASLQLLGVPDWGAFTFVPETGLLALAVQDRWPVRPSGEAGTKEATVVNEVRVFHLDAETGFTPRGALSMRGFYEAGGGRVPGSQMAPWISRTVLATDGMHDFVYAISSDGVRVAQVGALDKPLATALLSPSASVDDQASAEPVGAR